MPLRSNLLTQRWSTLDPPILPFLAPRVFTPWPSYGGRTRERPRARRQLHDKAGDLVTDVENKIATPRRVEADKGLLKNKRVRGAWSLSIPHEHLLAKTSPEEAQEFLRKYDEIWSTRSSKQKLSKPAPERPPLNNEKSSVTAPKEAASRGILEGDRTPGDPKPGELSTPREPCVEQPPESNILVANSIEGPTQTIEGQHAPDVSQHDLDSESKALAGEDLPIISSLVTYSEKKEDSITEFESQATADKETPRTLTRNQGKEEISPRDVEGAGLRRSDESSKILNMRGQSIENDLSRPVGPPGAIENASFDIVSKASAQKSSWSQSKYERIWRLTPASVIRRNRSLSNKRKKPSRMKASWAERTTRSRTRSSTTSRRNRRIQVSLQRYQVEKQVLDPSNKTQIQKHGQEFSSSRQTQRLAEYRDGVLKQHHHLQAHLLRRVKRWGIDAPRTKFVRLPRISEDWFGEFSPVWNTSFAGLDLRNDKWLAYADLRDGAIVKSTSPTMRRLRDWFLRKCTNLPAAERFWQIQTPALRAAVWPELMIHALTAPPSIALRALVATCHEPYPPSYAIADCIEYILRKQLRVKKQGSVPITKSIFRWIFRILARGPEQQKSYVNLTQVSIRIILREIDVAHLKSFYEALGDYNQPIERDTLLHFASRFGKSGQVSMALEILKRMKAEGIDFGGPEMASVCTTILQRKNRVEEEQSTTSDLALFEFMLECGMEPNVVHYTVLIHNTFQAKHHEVGWQIFNSMTAYGIEPNAYTYSVLINDAKKRSDRAAIHRIWTDVQAKGIRNTHIVTDILHSILLLDLEKRPLGSKGAAGKDTTFGVMLSVYCAYFRIEPLAHVAPVYMDAWSDLPRPATRNLSLAVPEFDLDNRGDMAQIEDTVSPRADPPEQLLEPDNTTLTVMMTALVRDLPKPPRDRLPYESRPYATRPYTLRFYEHFHSLVKAGDPIAAEIVQKSGDRVYNLAIIGLGRAQETLHFCTEVIGNMLSHSQDESHAKQPLTLCQDGNISPPPPAATPTHSHVDPPKPTIRTWTTLLKVFLDRNQPRAAEKVLQMMASRGIEPDLVTWQAQVVGYSRMQNIDKAIDTVDRMEYAGFQPDDLTSRYLEWIKDRQAVAKAFSKTEMNRRWTEKFGRTKEELEQDEGVIVMKQLKEALDQDEARWEILEKDVEYPLDDIVVTDQYKAQGFPFHIARKKQVTGASEGRDENQDASAFKFEPIITEADDKPSRRVHHPGKEVPLPASYEHRAVVEAGQTSTDSRSSGSITMPLRVKYVSSKGPARFNARRVYEKKRLRAEKHSLITRFASYVGVRHVRIDSPSREEDLPTGPEEPRTDVIRPVNSLPKAEESSTPKDDESSST